jgi:aspartyl-tRNA(Asn)/glutamyl-tRNA(Gln) amidotransferase subunit A
MVTISDFKGTSARANVEAAIAKAHEHESFNAILSLTEKRALERADLVDQGKITGRLAGVPFIAKDNFLTLDSTTSAASKMLEHFDAPIQATAIEKLEAEGAICIGKANLDAFAHGGSTENSAFGPTKNAHNTEHVAGGSSGGSAVVVALGIVPFALGTDTGGSIRQPASFNGVVGIKPTYGMVSRFGVISMASSTDTIGVLAGSTEDAGEVMDIISGQDTRDMTTLPDFYTPQSVDGQLKVGVVKEAMTDDVDAEVRALVQKYCDDLRAAGHIVEEVSLPILKYVLGIYYVVVPAEISSNLGRYDGIRYGKRSSDATTLSEVYGKSRDAGFVAENKRRIMIGSYVLSSGYFDAYYLQAQKARTVLINEFNELFSGFDALVMPVAPTPAFKLGENTADPVKMYLADVMTVPASLAGMPAISVPAGESASGLPIGVQLIGPRQSDAKILALAQQIEGSK